MQLIELAAKAQREIAVRGMRQDIINNGNGTWTVRVFGQQIGAGHGAEHCDDYGSMTHSDLAVAQIAASCRAFLGIKNV